MQQLANQRRSAAKTEQDFIKRQLETDFANATQEALEEKRAELKTAEACAKQAEAALAALASKIQQQVRLHRKDRQPRRSRPGQEDPRPGARQAEGADRRPRLRRSPLHDARRRQAPRRPTRQPPTRPRAGREVRRRQEKRPGRSQQGRHTRTSRKNSRPSTPRRRPEPRRTRS